MSSKDITSFDFSFELETTSKRATEEWKEIFSHNLSDIFSTIQYSIDFKFLYRARLNLDRNHNSIDFFKHSKELWAPPRKIVMKQGRCNSVNQSLLYVTTHPTTTIFELLPKSGAELTIIEYRSVGEIAPISLIGRDLVALCREDLKKIFQGHFRNSKPESLACDRLISNLFSSANVNSPEYPIYNLTNALTQIFLNNQKLKVKDSSLVAPKSIGLIYPSVQTSKPLGINIVFKPKSVYQSLKPNIGYKYKIVKRLDNHRYHIMLTHQTSKIYPNGEMRWKTVINPQMEYVTDL